MLNQCRPEERKSEGCLKEYFNDRDFIVVGKGHKEEERGIAASKPDVSDGTGRTELAGSTRN